ncbi:MAG: prephenate dehydrogenase [Blastocatellia bacterium]
MKAPTKVERICIVGCGLIGGSVALALRRAGFRGVLTAHDAPGPLQRAIERSVVDHPEDSFANGTLCEADLLYLAAPIGAILDFLRRHGRQIRPGTLVTDAASTKREICRVAVETLPAGVWFVGGHPMAGSEHSGVEYARADLFDRAVYALVPLASGSPWTPPEEKFSWLVSLIESIGARPLVTLAEEHDRAVALVSHLPQLLATTLASLLADPSSAEPSPEGAGEPHRQLARRLAAGGWRDMTRLAGSSFSVWRDILITNQPMIRPILARYIDQLQHLQESLEQGDYQALRQLFAEGNQSLQELRDVHYRPFEKL